MGFSYVDHLTLPPVFVLKSFIVKKPNLFVYVLSMAILILESQRYVVETDIIWFAKLKIITVWSLESIS